MVQVENLFMQKLLLLEGRKKQFLNVLRRLVECWMLQVCSDNLHMVRNNLKKLLLTLYLCWSIIVDVITHKGFVMIFLTRKQKAQREKLGRK